MADGSSRGSGIMRLIWDFGTRLTRRADVPLLKVPAEEPTADESKAQSDSKVEDRGKAQNDENAEGVSGHPTSSDSTSEYEFSTPRSMTLELHIGKRNFLPANMSSTSLDDNHFAVMSDETSVAVVESLQKPSSPRADYDGSEAPRLATWSLGAELHDERECKPCLFYHTVRGCHEGAECAFCHYCPIGEVQQRREEKTTELRFQEKRYRRQEERKYRKQLKRLRPKNASDIKNRTEAQQQQRVSKQSTYEQGNGHARTTRATTNGKWNAEYAPKIPQNYAQFGLPVYDQEWIPGEWIQPTSQDSTYAYMAHQWVLASATAHAWQMYNAQLHHMLRY
eukprot:GEMP01054630.1.p1 GENE.GEMP01054630.1~~GEMP01054630.1.p1  ORF type:complete len:352 (+),score=80.33 GEMP01054630.1:46-1056(+)